MWAWLASFLAGPVVNGVIEAYKARLAAGNTADKLAVDLAGRELVVQQRELEIDRDIKLYGKWYDPEHLFGYIMVTYFGTVVVWDKVLGDITHHSTDTLQGDILTWAGWIMAFYVGMRTGTQGIAAIIKAVKHG